MNRDSSHIGKILKCHLILEHYLDNYIKNKNKIENLKEMRLSFYQKACLLPKKGTSAAIVRPGILQINKIRNKFSHDFNASVSEQDISSLLPIIEVARPKLKKASIVRKIEGFTTVACTWLIVTPLELEDVFQRAFSHIIVQDPEE
jgi:hypothetical protein